MKVLSDRSLIRRMSSNPNPSTFGKIGDVVQNSATGELFIYQDVVWGGTSWMGSDGTYLPYLPPKFGTTATYTLPGSGDARAACGNGTTLYVADYSNETIYIMDGYSSTVADSFTIDNHTINDMVYNPDDGYIYCADDQTNNVRVLDPVNKTELTAFASGTSAPYGITIIDGNIVVSNYDGNVYFHDGLTATILKTMTFTFHQWYHGIAYDGANLSVFADSKIYVLKGKWPTSNEILREFNHPDKYSAFSLAFDGSHLVYQSSSSDHIFIGKNDGDA